MSILGRGRGRGHRSVTLDKVTEDTSCDWLAMVICEMKVMIKDASGGGMPLVLRLMLHEKILRTGTDQVMKLERSGIGLKEEIGLEQRVQAVLRDLHRNVRNSRCGFSIKNGSGMET